MAVILVSGGTYSGSGDLTCDAVVVGGVYGTDPEDSWPASTFICPDGVLTISGNSGIGYSNSAVFVRDGRGVGKDTWTHNGGTVRFTGIGEQRVIDYANARWYWNNVEIYNDKPGVTEGVLWGSPWYSDTDIAGDLTISGNADYYVNNKLNAHYTVSGNVNIISGAFIRNSIPINSDESNSFGSLTIGADGTYAAALNGDEYLVITSGSSDGSAYFCEGTFTPNEGTVAFHAPASFTQKIRTASGDLYNMVVSGAAGSMVLGFESGYSDVDILNDLTIDAGEFRLDGDKLHCLGNVVINDGTLDCFTSDDGSSSHRMGSLIIQTDGIYECAPQTNITGPNNTALGGYLWRTNAGTFNHNNGLVYFDTGSYNGADIYPASNQYFYDLTLSGTGTVEMYGCTIANDYDLGTNVIFRPITTTQSFTVSGTATINGFFGKDGYPQTTATDNTFGALDIKSGGTYYATSGTTTLFGKTGITYQQTGTYTHNSGTFLVSGGSQDFKWGDTLHGPFYDLRVDAGDTTQMRGAALTVENSMIVETGFVVPSYNGGSGKIWTFGTATGSAYFSGLSSPPMKVFDSTEAYPFIIKAANPVFPAELKGNEWDWYYGTGPTNDLTGQHIKFSDVDCQFNINTTNGTDNETNKFYVIGQSSFKGFTIETSSSLNVSGQRAQFGGLLRLDANSELIVSGAMILVTGAGGFTEHNNADVLGLTTATLWTDLDSGVTVSPAAGNTAPYFKDVFWAGEGRINQDRMFGDSNLICAGTFDGNARPVGHNSSITKRVKTLVIPNAGTYTNAATYSTSQAYITGSFSNRGGLFASSSALDFADTYAQTADNVNPLTASLTWECWFKAEAGANTDSLMSNDGGTGKRGAYLRVDGGGTDITWFVNDVGIISATNLGDIDDGSWHNIAAVYDSGNYLYLYLDGKLVAKDGATGTPSSASDVRFYLGHHQNNSAYLTGQIARASVWSSALTASEIRTMLFQDFDTATTTNCVSWYQFDEGEGGNGTIISDKTGNGNNLYLYANWADGGTWTAGNKVSSSAANLYIGNRGANATVFASSYFPIANRSLIEGSKFASKAHDGTLYYYIDTSGAADYLPYQQLGGAPIGSANIVEIMPNSYFTFDTSADNEQCHTLLNDTGSTVRINSNEDFYTQDFENKGTWLRNSTYGGIIHDDGSTPYEYEPIDIMDDQDSGFDAEDLID